jgi:hypothetical protein
MEAVGTDNGPEFRVGDFVHMLDQLAASQRRTRAGRPSRTDACSPLQQTLREECWRSFFARALVPKLAALGTRSR